MENIEENVGKILNELRGGNGFGEPVSLVAATKTRTPEEINRAIRAGVCMIGENKVQEFRNKYGFSEGAEHHFIGNLQTNKVKYLIGKCDLIHSVGSVHLAEEIARLSLEKGTVQNILLEINLGEQSKGGIPYAEADDAYRKISALAGLRVKGFMAMLPADGELPYLVSLCRNMRRLFGFYREKNAETEYLSMGMSGDYKICLEHGSNMVRLGSRIFGERKYP